MQNKHEISELYEMQALPLSIKVQMTKRRIRDWVKVYGKDGVYVSFSGGKDSTVLLHIAREIFPDIKAVFVDTGLEFPEIRQFVGHFENVDWLKPKITFKQVIEKYGYPFISKEVSECVYGAKKYLSGGGIASSIGNYSEVENTRKTKYQFEYNKLIGQGKYASIMRGGGDNKYRKFRGLGENSNQSKDTFWEDDEGKYP